MTSEFERTVTSGNYRAAKEQLANRSWRLDNLYAIKDKDGEAVQFRRNRAQRFYSSQMWYRDVLLKARQLGFSTDIDIKILDDAIFQSNITAGIIDFKVEDATKKLDKCRFAYQRLPLQIREQVRLVRDNDSRLEFSNGSNISAGTGYRGDTPQILHISEYGKISADKPDVAKEIKTGAIVAVPQRGKIYVESTGHGRGGEFYDMVQIAKNLRDTGSELSTKDFKLHFFPWFLDPAYREKPGVIVISAYLQEYFERLRVKHKIVLDAAQKTWYAVTHDRELGPDDMKTEYPSHVDEPFEVSLEGTFFKNELQKARLEGRIGRQVLHDPTRPVHTMWDIGMDDENVCLFFQIVGEQYRFLDFAKMSGEGVTWCPRVLQEKAQQRRFIYGKHYGPHDLKVRDWSSKIVQPRYEIAAGLGVKFEVVEAPFEKADGIDAARQILNMSLIDEEHCTEFVSALDNYRKTWNRRLSTYTGEPVHNWASHPADALQTGALGLEPEEKRSTRKRAGKEKERTAWSA